MVDVIRAFKNVKFNYVENATISVFSVLLGILLSKFWDKYLDWFALGVFFVVIFFVMFWKSAQKTTQLVDGI